MLYVGSEEEAEAIVEMGTSLGYDGTRRAEMLALEQTLENLALFSSKLHMIHDEVIVPQGRCDCKDEPKRKEKP